MNSFKRDSAIKTALIKVISQVSVRKLSADAM